MRIWRSRAVLAAGEGGAGPGGTGGDRRAPWAPAAADAVAARRLDDVSIFRARPRRYCYMIVPMKGAYNRIMVNVKWNKGIPWEYL